MKVTINKEILVKALSLVNGIISPRTTLPILSNVLVETKAPDLVVITSTDMEIGVSKQVEATIEEEGSVTIPAKKLFEIVRELPAKTVTLEITKTHAVHITSGPAFIKLIGLPKDDFPTFPSFDENAGFALSTDLLSECFRMTSFAISSDENKYVLNGMLMKVVNNKLEVVATDGRRLAFIQKEITGPVEDLQVIIPTKTVYELMKTLVEASGQVRIISLKNQLVFQFQGVFVITRLIEGHFPDYEKVIPKSFQLSSELDRKEMLSVLKRAYLLTSKEFQGVKLDFLNNKILVSAKSPNLGELKEELAVEQQTDGISIGFNPTFLLDVFKNVEDEKILFQISESDKPGVIKRKSDDYTCVIMPMQIA